MCYVTPVTELAIEVAVKRAVDRGDKKRDEKVPRDYCVRVPHRDRPRRRVGLEALTGH